MTAVLASPPAPPSSARMLAADVLRCESAAIARLVERLDDEFDRAVELLVDCAGHVIVAGVGKSGLIGQKLSATLSSTGTPSHFLHPSEALHGDLGRVRPDDLLVALSYGGQTDDVLSLAACVRQEGLVVISMVGEADCRLARLSDVVLSVGQVQEACPLRLAPTASTTAMLALGDALALAASQVRGWDADDFHKRHPGGQLGRLMLPLASILRRCTPDGLPLVSQSSTVAAALCNVQGVARRAGAVLVVDVDGQLSGIFTDADFRRLVISAGPGCLERSMGEVMTCRPLALAQTDRVRDAVRLVREHRVDEIPVVDGAGRPVGLVDVQDLLALGVLVDKT